MANPMQAVTLAGLRVERYVASLSDFFRAPTKYVAARAAAGDVVLYDMPGIVFHHYANRPDLEGTHIRPHQDQRAVIKLFTGHRDVINPQLRDPFTRDTEAKDLHALSVASRKERVWLMTGPQFPRQIRQSTATSRLRAAFGPPRLRTRIGRFDVFLFERR